MNRPVTQLYEFGPFTLDPARRLLLRDGQVVQLTPKAFDTLLTLVENHHRVLDKDELLQTVWPDTAVEERNLTVNISTLRKTLGETPNEHRYIITVPGRGYRFSAVVREVESGSADSTGLSDTPSGSRAETNEASEALPDNALRSRRRPARLAQYRKAIVATTILLVFALLASLYVYLKRVRTEPPQPSRSTETPTLLRSIAVLPFKPVTAESRDESLELGMADTLITRLSNLRQVVVRPMGTVRRYAGLEQDPVAAGQEQGVDAVLDGSIQRANERVRVTARLMSTVDGRQLWADKFDERFTDIFAVQDSISERVVAALAVKLSGEEKTSLTKRYTASAEAYQLYLKGRFFASKWTPEGVNKGVAYFNQAIALDPGYALAYDGLAYCYYAANWWSPWKATIARGKALTQRALEIDSGLAEAHTSLGVINTWLDYDWPSAEKEFKQALELKPNYASAHQWYGFLLIPLGRAEESIAEAKRAIELDPLSAEANAALGVYLFYARRYDEAGVQLRATIELEPGYWFARLYLARVEERKGELAAAIAELEKTRRMDGAPAEVLSALGYAYALAGRRAEAEKIIAELNEQSKQTYIPPYNLATVFAGLGQNDQAFAYLEKEYREGAYYLNYLEVDPELDGFRSDARFTELLRRMNFRH